MSGKTIIQKIVAANEGDNIIPVNSAALQAGTYVIVVRNTLTSETVTLKFIK